LDDDLMKLFGGDRVKMIADSLGATDADDLPIEFGLMSRTIENAQKRIEGRNFAIRKNVLQ
jgi:preprotein translocase subunit SecA